MLIYLTLIEQSLFYILFIRGNQILVSMKVAIQYPAAVTACNVDLETLITDSNRSIATLAITTLLKVIYLIFQFFI